MRTLALLVLCLLPLQEPNKQPEIKQDRTVALAFEHGEVFLTVADAENEYKKLKAVKRRTLDQEKWFAALTVALGTISERETAPHVNSTRERLDWEIRRGVRPPLQKPDPKEVIQ